METTLRLDENVSEGLRRAEKAGHDLTPAMGSIAQMMATATKLNFRNQSDPLGVPWKRSERAKAFGGMTLILSGDLFGSIREDWGRDYAKAGPEASGGAAIYAAIHQWGGRILPGGGTALRTPKDPRKGVTIPARPYVGWNDRMKTRAGDILIEHLASVFVGTPTPGAAA